MQIAAATLALLAMATLATSSEVDKSDQNFWNSKFGDSHTEFNREPNRLLIDAIRDRKPGTAVDLGMGQGRNAIYLAQHGWQVTGVDLSDVAIAQARARATQLGVKLNTVLDGLDDYDLGQSRWDLITLFYVHAWYRSSKPRDVQRIKEALKPGGLVVIEGFAGNQSFLFQPNELIRDFSDFRILRYEDMLGEADWAPGRKSHLIRLVAEKGDRTSGAALQ